MRRIVSAMCVAAVALPLVSALPAARAAAAVTTWQFRPNDYGESQVVAGNINAHVVAAVCGASVCTRRITDDHYTAWRAPLDGSGAPVLPVRLAVSWTEVFAILPGGTLVQLNAETGAWRTIRVNVKEVLASREGRTITMPNGASRFEPHIYTIEGPGEIWRRDDQVWRPLLTGVPTEYLAEYGTRGAAQLYALTEGRREIITMDSATLRWARVGGPADSIAAGRREVVMVRNGRPYFFTGAPYEWLPDDPHPGGEPPFRPGGRIEFGDNAMYYIPPDGSGVWGQRRYPDTPVSPEIVPADWTRLAATRVDAMAAFAPHPPGRPDVVAFGPDGDAALRWSQITPAAPSTWPVGTLGVTYQVVRPLAADWTGTIKISRIDGATPPNLDLFFVGGHLVANGFLPTFAHTYDFTVTLQDSSGAQLQVPIRIQVVDAVGRSWLVDQQILSHVHGIGLVNCRRSLEALHMWARGYGETGWFYRGPLPPRAHDPGCAGGEPTSGWLWVDPAPDKFVEVVVVRPDADLCGGANAPDVAACVLRRWWVLGGGTEFQGHLVT